MNKDIRKVSFTGSVSAGQKIQQNSAVNGVKPVSFTSTCTSQVTLELGGKSALVIFDDSDVQSAVSCAMLANFLNQGRLSSINEEDFRTGVH